MTADVLVKLDQVSAALAVRQEAEQEQRRRARIPQQDARVVGGIFHPEPVNKQAGMLLAKAPWIHHPPTPAPRYTSQEPKVAHPADEAVLAAEPQRRSAA